jgi:hypothetical protein
MKIVGMAAVIPIAVIFLRDRHGYLEEIQFSSTGCLLRVNIGSVSTGIPVPRDHFSEISLGTNTVDETVPRFIPLTVSSPNAIIAGDVTVRIEAPNEYIVIGPEWANVLLSDSTIVIAASLSGAENGRVIYGLSVDVARCFAISEHIILLENSTAPVGLWSAGSASSYYSLSHAPLDLIPMECANELCAIRDSRRYIVFPEDVQFSFAVDGINPSLLFPSSMTLNMDNIPIGASFALGPAFGWTSPAHIEFKDTQKRLGNLTISDPMRLTFPNPFSLIVDRLAVDFRSFKRFFRDVGVFANGDVLHVNHEFVLTEGHYYREVMITPAAGSS